MNFYFSVKWGPRHQFSNSAPQFLAPALVTSEFCTWLLVVHSLFRTYLKIILSVNNLLRLQETSFI